MHHPADFLHKLEEFEDQEPFFNDSIVKALDKPEEDEDDEDPNKLFSVYKITTDGRTPFNKENSSEIVYDDDGEPSEVVVYVDASAGEETNELDTSESRIYADRRTQDTDAVMYDEQDGFEHEPDLEEEIDHEIDVDPLYETAKKEAAIKRKSFSSGHGGGFDIHGGGGYGGGGGHSGGGHGGGGLGGSGHGGGGHGGGYGDVGDIQGSYGGHHDHGYVPHKSPGPFGYGKPNYKCEYAKETLYVTKTDYKFNKKCYHILNVKCKSKYDTGKKISYKKVCNEFSVTKCRTVYATKFKSKCWLVYKKKCHDTYKTKVDWVYKEKCSTSYEKECSGYGYHKHCHEVPREHCKQVPTKVEKQIKSVKCRKVPDKKCKVCNQIGLRTSNIISQIIPACAYLFFIYLFLKKFKKKYFMTKILHGYFQISTFPKIFNDIFNEIAHSK